MIKILGVFFIIFSCTAMSKIKADSVRKKFLSLLSLRDGILYMADTISFYKTCLPEIILHLSDDEHDIFFGKVSEMLRNNDISIKDAWQSTAKSVEKFYGNEVCDVLLGLGKNIGNFDAETETENLKNTALALERVCSSEEAKLRQNLKLIKSFGLIGGALIVILFV